MIAVRAPTRHLPQLLHFASAEAAHRDLISRLSDLLFTKGVQGTQIAVLATSNRPLKFLEEALERHNSAAPAERRIEYVPLISSSSGLSSSSLMRR
jgi:hypothetical protein